MSKERLLQEMLPNICSRKVAIVSEKGNLQGCDLNIYFLDGVEYDIRNVLIVRGAANFAEALLKAEKAIKQKIIDDLSAEDGV